MMTMMTMMTMMMIISKIYHHRQRKRRHHQHHHQHHDQALKGNDDNNGDDDSNDSIYRYDEYLTPAMCDKLEGLDLLLGGWPNVRIILLMAFFVTSRHPCLFIST